MPDYVRLSRRSIVCSVCGTMSATLGCVLEAVVTTPLPEVGKELVDVGPVYVAGSPREATAIVHGKTVPYTYGFVS